MSETLKAPNIRELSLPLGGAAICRCGVADGWLNGSKILRIALSNSPIQAGLIRVQELATQATKRGVCSGRSPRPGTMT